MPSASRKDDCLHRCDIRSGAYIANCVQSQSMQVKMAAGERGSKRHLALVEIISRHPDRYTLPIKWENTDDLGIDLVIGKVGFELKEDADAIGSMFNGHLAGQRRNAKEMGLDMCLVIIFGSPEDVVEAIPDRDQNGWRDEKIKSREQHRWMDGYAALLVSGFIPLYLSRDHKITMEHVVDIAWAAENNAIGLPGIRAESPAVAMMQCLPKVGFKLSKAMEETGFRVALAAEVVKTGKTGKTREYQLITDPGILRSVPGMGQKTAKGIIEAIYGTGGKKFH